MDSSRDSMFSDRPASWLAWCASLVFHACLLALLVDILPAPSADGASETPLREAGIVLKQMSDEGPSFVSEEDVNASAEANSNPSARVDPKLAALPDAAEFPAPESALPNVPAIGFSTLVQDQSGDVGQMASGGTPSKTIGNKATVSVFGISGTGTRFVYVFDRSISMAGAPLRVAKQQLISSLDSLDTIHQFQIIFFNHEPQAWDLTGGQNRIAFATDSNKRLAEKFVRGISATGGTFRRTALQLALRLRPDVIFFLSDTDDPMESNDLMEAIRRARRDSIAINTIEYGIGESSVDDNFLVQLARQTGGRYVYVNTQRLGQ